MSKKKASPYESYEDFLKAAIRAYWDTGEASKINFISLLLASRETWQVAWEGATAPGSGKKILTGAAGAAAVAILLRTLLGGPIGILLTGASIASLVALYVKNHRRIWARAKHYEILIDDYRKKFDEVRDDYVDGGLRKDQRDLMVDGLMSRFLTELDEYEPELEEDEEEDEEEPEERTDFERHADEKRAEEEAAREAEEREKAKEASRAKEKAKADGEKGDRGDEGDGEED